MAYPDLQKKKKNPNSWPIRLLLYLTLDRVKPNKEKVLNHVSFFFFLVFPFNTEVTSMMGMRQTNSGMHPTGTLMLIHIWAWWKRRRGRRNTQTPLNVTILSVRSLPQRRCGKQLKLFSGWHPKNLQKLITDFNHYCADFIRVGPGGGGGEQRCDNMRRWNTPTPHEDTQSQNHNTSWPLVHLLSCAISFAPKCRNKMLTPHVEMPVWFRFA